MNASAYVRSRPLWALDVSDAAPSVPSATSSRPPWTIGVSTSSRSRDAIACAGRENTRVVELVEPELVLERRAHGAVGDELAARPERAPREEAPDDGERHRERARQPLLRRRRVDERLDGGLEPVLERVPDAGDLQQARERRRRARARRPGSVIERGALAVVSVLVVAARLGGRFPRKTMK